MKNKLVLLLLLAVSVVIHWRWVFVPQIFGGGDFSSFLKSPQELNALFAPPVVWDSLWGNGFGTYNIIMAVYPMYLAMGILAKAGINLAWILKITNFFPAVVLTPICSFLLFRRVSGSKIGAFVGSVVYSYNTYILLLQKGGILLINISYALVPLFLYYSSRALAEKSFRLAFVAGIVGFAVSSFDFRLFYLAAFLQSLYFLFFLARSRFMGFIRSCQLFSLIIFIPLLVSAYWLLPTFLSGKAASNTAIASGLFGWDVTLSHAVAFFHPFWDSGKSLPPGTMSPIPGYLYLLPIISLFGLFKVKRFPDLPFYLLVLLLGFLLVKQSAPPFPNLYLWLFKNFPGFNAFRESSKFFLFIGLGYGALISASLATFQQSRRWMFKYWPAIFLVASFLLEARFLATGQAKGMFVPKSVPSLYLDYRQKLLGNSSFGRVLWVPSYSAWSYSSPLHPKVSAYSLYMERLQGLLASYPNYMPLANPSRVATKNYSILEIFSQDFSLSYLRLLGISSIAVPASDPNLEDDLFNDTYGLYADRPALVSFLDKLPYLSKDKSFSGLDIYEVSSPAAQFFVSSSPLTLSNISQAEPVAVFPNGENSYLVRLPYSPVPVFFHFSQSTDSGWQLYDEKHEQFLSRDSQSQLLGINSFVVYPDSAPAGTSRSFILSYAPQKLAQIGQIISVSSLIVAVGIIIILKSRHA